MINWLLISDRVQWYLTDSRSLICTGFKISMREFWQITFNTTKSKPVIHYHKTDLELSSVIMNSWILNMAFSALLGATFTSDLNWNTYIRSITKNAGKMAVSLYFPWTYRTPLAILDLYKSQMRSKIAVISEKKQHNALFITLTEFKSVLAAL